MKKLFTNKFFWLSLVLLVAVSYFYFKNKTDVNGKEQVLAPNKDKIVTPQTKNIIDSLTLTGSLDAQTKADINFQTSGILSWVGVKEGDRVRKWQTIASLDKADLRKRLQKTFNAYQTELSQFNDTQDKYKTEKENLILTDEMKRILSRSQFSLDNSVIDYELADLTIKYASIYTPIEGIIVKAEQPVAGVNITPATATFTVVDPNTLFLKAEVDQEDVSKIKVGQRVKVKLDAFPDEELDSTISYISFSPTSNTTSTTYEVRALLPKSNTDLKYRLGMDGDANIIFSEISNALTIPTDAIIEEDSKKYVYVKNPDSNILTKKEVQTGISNDNDTEITQGINPNDQIVIKSQ